MADIHNLAKFCRVCGGRLEKAKSRAPAHDCIKHQERLMATFSLDVAMDNPAIHPQHFCNSCYAAPTWREVAAVKGVPFKHAIEIYKSIQRMGALLVELSNNLHAYCSIYWYTPSRFVNILRLLLEEEDTIRNQEQWTTLWMHQPCITDCLHSVAPHPFTDTSDNAVYITDLSTTLDCPRCCHVLSQPVQLDCGRLVCAYCCRKWLELSEET